jgi:hypothetical protein
MEQGLEAAETEKATDERAHRQALWLLRRDLAVISWRLTDLNPKRPDAKQLLERAVKLSEDAIPLSPTPDQDITTRQNLLYYLTDLWGRSVETEQPSLRRRGKELLAEITEKIGEISKADIEELDTIARAESLFGDPAAAKEAAKLVSRRLHDLMDAQVEGQPARESFQALTRDQQDMYLYSQRLISG